MLFFTNPKKQTEEELKIILSDSYKNVGCTFISSKKGAKTAKDNSLKAQKAISETEVGLERACRRLLDREEMNSPEKLAVTLLKTKILIVNAQLIKVHARGLYSSERFEKLINFLIKLTCEKESALAIEKIGWKLIAEIDLRKAFKDIKKEVLAQQFAHQILLGEMPEVPRSKRHVTIFVDEAVDDLISTAGAEAKKVGNGAYIICKGNLKSEMKITANNTIKCATFSFGETKRTEKIAEEVIWKALSYLAGELRFRGEVHVFSDNAAAVKLWQNNPLNKATAGYFAEFTIKHIPREKNTVADKLVRENKVMPIPKDEFKAMVERANLAESLEAEIKELRAAQNAKHKSYFDRILKRLPRSA